MDQARNFYKILGSLGLFLAFSLEIQALRVAISSSPSNLSPFFSTDSSSQNINRLVHASLIDFDREMNPMCRLCDSFRESVNEKGEHRIHFVLKKDKTFRDGTPFKAIHVKEAWKLFTDKKKIKSIFRFAFSKIKDVEIKGPYELSLVYGSFAPDNLSNLVLFKILRLGKDDSFEIQDLIGLGEYSFESIEPLRVVLKPRLSSDPVLDFKVVKDETTLALKLINQEVDLSLVNISPRKLQWLKEKYPKLRYFESEGTNYNYLALNHQRYPVSDKNFRKALSLLIPREKLQKYKLKGNVTLAKTMFSDAFKELSLDFPLDKYDPKVAAELLMGLGLTKKEGFWFNKEKKVSLDWKVSNNKATIEVVQVLKNEFEKAGIEVKLTILEWGTFMRSFKKGDFDILMSRWVGFTGPEMLNYVFSSKSFPPKGGNRGKFKHDEIDKWLDKGKSSWDRKERIKNYQAALKLIRHEYPYISLWHPKVSWVGISCISKLTPYPNESFLAFNDLKSHCHVRK